jgi:hypothetical protein
MCKILRSCKTFCFLKLITKDHSFFLYVFFSFLVIEFQNCGNKHDHGSLSIKNALMYEVHTNEEIEQFVDMFLFVCDVSLLSNPLQNAQQHQHTYM